MWVATNQQSTPPSDPPKKPRRSFSEGEPFVDDIVYSDEVTCGDFTIIDDETTEEVYNIAIDVSDGKCIQRDKVLKLKRCIVTTEKFIEHELRHQNIDYDQITEPSKTYDPNLEVLIVKSTSNKKPDTYRHKLTEYIKEVYKSHVNLIVDGIDNM